MNVLWTNCNSVGNDFNGKRWHVRDLAANLYCQQMSFSEGKSSLIFEMEGAALGSLVHNLVLKSLNWHCNKRNQDSLVLDLEILIPYV